VNFEAIIERFQARRAGSSYMATCPAHDDRTPSLSITEKEGKILLHCLGGCNVKDVLGAAGLTFEDLHQGPIITAEYDYRDEVGQLLFQVLRYEPKTFKQRHPDGNGGWIWNLNGTRRVLYNLPDVLKADSLLIVEGEKDVESARKMGIVATCNPHGAGKWREEYATYFEGKHVTVIPDNDPPGHRHAEQVAVSLHGKAASVAICKLPEACKDLSAWQLSAASLIDLIKQAPAWTPGVVDETEYLKLFHSPEECRNAPDIQFAIDGFLQCEGMTFIGGLSGHSKTWVMLSIAKALLLGEGTKLWSTFAVRETANRVLYLIPEVGLSSFMFRAKRMRLMPYIDELRLLLRTLSKGPAPELNDPLMLAAAKGNHVVLDTAARFASGEENSAGDNARGLAADIFKLITAGARSVICAHHSPKTFEKSNVMTLEGILRGTGDIGAMATTVWGVKQLDEPQNIVYMECVKARDFTHCEPFQIRGRPCVDDGGDFILYRAPGESGSLSEEQAGTNPANKNKHRERDDRVSIVKKWISDDANLSGPEMVEKFAALGIVVNDATVRKYRIEARKAL
jgi:hypothetical protein